MHAGKRNEALKGLCLLFLYHTHGSFLLFFQDQLLCVSFQRSLLMALVINWRCVRFHSPEANNEA